MFRKSLLMFTLFGCAASVSAQDLSSTGQAQPSQQSNDFLSTALPAIATGGAIFFLIAVGILGLVIAKKNNAGCFKKALKTRSTSKSLKSSESNSRAITIFNSDAEIKVFNSPPIPAASLTHSDLNHSLIPNMQQ